MSDDFSLTWTTGRAPGVVLDAILDVHGWWGTGIRGRADAVGEVFEFEVPDTHWTRIEVTRIVPGELVEWRVLANRMTFVDDQSEWVGSTIRFALSPDGAGTRLDFTHEGLTPRWECFSACFEGWTWYAGASLPRLVETGVGTPFEDAGARQSWEAASAAE